MKTHFVLGLVAALVCVLGMGCQPKPSGAVTPDAVTALEAADASAIDADAPADAEALAKPFDVTHCSAACANLAKLGCPEGFPRDAGQSCVDVCTHAQTTKITDLKPACLASAKSVTSIRACRTVQCLPHITSDAGASRDAHRD